MVQIIQRPERKEDAGDAFAKAIIGYQQQKQDTQNTQSANKFFKEQFGVDLPSDPETRKIIATELMKGRSKEQLFNLQNEKLAQYFQNKESFTDQINGDTQFEQPTQKEFTPDENEFINFELETIKPGLGKLRHAQEKEKTKQKQQYRKEVRESFKDNEDYINKTFDQYEDSLRKEAILDRMDEVSEDTSESGIINLLRSLGMEDEWLQNPANEEYTKLALDLLGGGTLQADYGSRVLQSEFMVSQKRIPELMQTKEGRRQIAENIRTMLLPAKLKQERLQYYLDKAEREGKPLPPAGALRSKVLKDIKPQLDEAYDKFKQRNGRYKVKPGTKPDRNALEKYYYLSDGIEDDAFKMMKEDNYDVK